MNHQTRLKNVSVLFVYFGIAAFVAQAQTLTTLLSFNGTNGKSPVAFFQGADGNFYGAANAGGANGAGEIFKMTPAGTFAVRLSFKSPTVPTSLIQAKDGNFYGATESDGTNGKGPFSR